MPKNILIIAAHADDEVLGCGGTIAKHVKQGDIVKILFITDGVSSRSHTSDERSDRKASAYNASLTLGSQIIGYLNFPDQRLDSVPLLDIIQNIESIMQEYQPEILYTHFVNDLNMDHRIVHQAALTACRPLPNTSIKEIYSFEVPSATEWALDDNHFIPNVYIDISKTWDLKVQALQHYAIEMREFPHPRSFENLTALASIRGASVGLKKAEAFQLIRKIEEA